MIAPEAAAHAQELKLLTRYAILSDDFLSRMTLFARILSWTGLWSSAKLELRGSNACRNYILRSYSILFFLQVVGFSAQVIATWSWNPRCAPGFPDSLLTSGFGQSVGANIGIWIGWVVVAQFFLCWLPTVRILKPYLRFADVHRFVERSYARQATGAALHSPASARDDDGAPLRPSTSVESPSPGTPTSLQANGDLSVAQVGETDPGEAPATPSVSSSSTATTNPPPTKQHRLPPIGHSVSSAAALLKSLGHPASPSPSEERKAGEKMRQHLAKVQRRLVRERLKGSLRPDENSLLLRDIGSSVDFFREILELENQIAQFDPSPFETEQYIDSGNHRMDERLSAGDREVLSRFSTVIHRSDRLFLAELCLFVGACLALALFQSVSQAASSGCAAEGWLWFFIRNVGYSFPSVFTLHAFILTILVVRKHFRALDSLVRRFFDDDQDTYHADHVSFLDDLIRYRFRIATRMQALSYSWWPLTVPLTIGGSVSAFFFIVGALKSGNSTYFLSTGVFLMSGLIVVLFIACWIRKFDTDLELSMLAIRGRFFRRQQQAQLGYTLLREELDSFIQWTIYQPIGFTVAGFLITTNLVKTIGYFMVTVMASAFNTTGTP